ncbi:hypothetical protein CH263_13530 [Rhodococcus sp. 06-1059B-a]|nr:hypothetical protein [Rhodococcus sp. 06-1059B-a]OZD65158.1 hypothetical protein CH263_13530 [Rhodococcus sp. 06-1059B-a]
MTTGAPGVPVPGGSYTVRPNQRWGQDETPSGVNQKVRTPVVSRFEKGQNNLWGSGGFLGFLTQGIFGIIGGAADFIGGLLGLRNKADSAQQQANQAIENTAQVVKQVRAVMNSITAPFAESWMTQTPGQQVSFPDALLQRHPKRAGRPSPVAAPWIGEETIRTSNSDGGNNWFTTFETAYTPDKNVLVAAYIQSNYAVGRATIAFKVGAVASPCDMYIVVMRMLSDGNVEIAWVSPNQTPLISTGKATWSVTAPEDIPFDELEQMVIGIHQIGTGNVRPLAAIEKDQYPGSAETFPPQQAMNYSYSTALTAGSIIPKSGQVFTSQFLIWVGIGQRLYSGDPLPRSFVDDFGGAFTWTKVGSATAGIRDGRFSYFDSNDLKSFYYYPQPLAYADQRVEAYCSGPNSREQGMMLRGNAAGSSFFALVVTNNTAEIRQWTSKSESGYTALGGYSGATGASYWALEAIGSVLTAYQLVDNAWIPRIQIPGVGLTGGRWTGLFCDRAAFANSGEWDGYSARDMVELQEAA